MYIKFKKNPFWPYFRIIFKKAVLQTKFFLLQKPTFDEKKFLIAFFSQIQPAFYKIGFQYILKNFDSVQFRSSVSIAQYEYSTYTRNGYLFYYLCARRGFAKSKVNMIFCRGKKFNYGVAKFWLQKLNAWLCYLSKCCRIFVGGKSCQNMYQYY